MAEKSPNVPSGLVTLTTQTVPAARSGESKVSESPAPDTLVGVIIVSGSGAPSTSTQNSVTVAAALNPLPVRVIAVIVPESIDPGDASWTAGGGSGVTW